MALSVYDVMGREVAELVAGQLAAGLHDVRWTGRDARGQMLTSGVYIYGLKAGEYVDARILTIVR